MNEIICGDALEVLHDIPAGSVDLVFADPPYNIGKASWDKVDNYLEWCEAWITATAETLKPTGRSGFRIASRWSLRSYRRW